MQAIKLKVNKSTSMTTSNTKLKLKVNSSQNNKKEEFRVGADNYSKYEDQRDHIYEVPQMYLGGTTKMKKRSERILDLETLLFKENEISVPEGLERIFVEISSNAGDNAARSMREGIDPGEVTVTMTETSVKVRNGGIPIPVEIHPKEKVYVPEMIFGMLMSSSNYNKNKARTECGVNGYGAKLTNIFSKSFKITIGDPHNQALYTQSWSDNMKVKYEHKISKFGKNEKAFVEIEYIIDFLKFGYTDMKFPKEAFEFFARHIVDMAFTLKIQTSFNGKKFNIKNAKDYAKYYLSKDKVKKSIFYCSWPEGTETVLLKNVEFAKDKNILPKMEICAIDTPDEAFKVSFANGMWTRNGGVHLEAAFKSVATSVLETVNGSNPKKKKKGEKGEKNLKLTLNDVKKHISLIVNCWVEDPIFDGQGKRELQEPTPKVNIDEKVLKPIMKWELVSRLYAELDAKRFKASAKSDGKKKRFLSGMEKLKDANKAGTSESTNCTLYITEGDSALTYAKKLRSFIPGGKGNDYIGAYPLKGKPINVMNAPAIQVAENKEIKDLKQVLGLREGVDYRIEENYQTLRYGHLMILADADVDGRHILGLVMNLFHCKYPTLLARGFVNYLRTKILEVKKGGQTIKFYSQHEYDEWKDETPDYKTWKHAYFKGLGTSKTKDIEDESRNLKIVHSFYDEIAPYAMRLAFDNKLTDNRKQWISQWNPDYTVETMQVQPISSFINHEFIQFSIADVARSIPRFTDGLKVSQRKIIWTALKKWGKKAGNAADVMKVAQFAARVSESMAYMHGEKSLEGAIVGMAQNFVGSNNLPYLEREGEFGTRSMMGKDAASSRYIFTRPEVYVPYIYRKEDFPILDLVVDEGQEIEPVTLLPIIPMHLINGVCGIGTGSSSFIAAHNPLDAVYWLECKIKGLPLPKLVPWYRDFTGEIEIKSKVKKKIDESSETEDEVEENEDEEEKDEHFVDRNTKVSMFSYGTFEVEKQGRVKTKVVIKELPVGRSIDSYEVYLKRLREEKEITGYHDYSTAEKPHFEIFGMKKKPSNRSLKLIKTYGMSNMVLLDDKNRPVKYQDAEDIMETFYSIRLAYYQKRKDYILNDITEQIEILNAKIEFVLAVLKGIELIQENPKYTLEELNEKKAILTIGKNKKKIAEQMERCGFDTELLKKISLYALTEEEVQSFKDEIGRLIEERKSKEEKKIEDYWLDDLDDFVKVYCKHYKCKYESPKKVTLKVVN